VTCWDIERFSHRSKRATALLSLFFAETIFILTLCVYRFFTSNDSDATQVAALSFLNMLFLPAFAVDGVVNEKTIDLVASVFTVSLSLIYTVSNYHKEYKFNFGSATNTFKLEFIVAIIFVPLNVILAFVSYLNFGWAVYRRTGADEAMMLRYKQFRRLESWFKISFWLLVNSVFSTMSLRQDSESIIVGLIALFLAIAFIFLGWVGIRLENSRVTIVFLLLYPSLIAYNLYSVKYPIADDDHCDEPQCALVVFLAVANSLVHVLVLVWTVICYRSFGSGLRNVLSKDSVEQRPVLSNIFDNDSRKSYATLQDA